jgi:hypothetical protein
MSFAAKPNVCVLQIRIPPNHVQSRLRVATCADAGAALTSLDGIGDTLMRKVKWLSFGLMWTATCAVACALPASGEQVLEAGQSLENEAAGEAAAPPAGGAGPAESNTSATSTPVDAAFAVASAAQAPLCPDGRQARMVPATCSYSEVWRSGAFLPYTFASRGDGRTGEWSATCALRAKLTATFGDCPTGFLEQGARATCAHQSETKSSPSSRSE